MSESEESSELEQHDHEWLFENQHHEDFWHFFDYLHSEQTAILQEKLRNNIKIKQIDQKTYQTINATKIKDIYDKYLLDASEYLNLLQTCHLIQQQCIPTAILLVITSYTGDGEIPISYTLSAVPFWYVNRDSLKIWWYETQSTVDHRGLFIPKNIKTAAEEFASYIQERLNRDIRYYKYQNLMVPTINVSPINLTNEFQKTVLKEQNQQYGISLTLPTQGHKEVGGIEMFQRLYLETAFNKPELDAFCVDLAEIYPHHGDDWCFGGNGLILMADGTQKLVSQLNVGDKIKAFPNLVSIIKCVVVSNINGYINMVHLGKNGWITSEHPMLMSTVNDGLSGLSLHDKYDNLSRLDSDEIANYDLRWGLPIDIGMVHRVFVDKIYNFVLDRHHTVNVNGFWCLTLGDGYKGDLIGHEFWSNSEAILTFLQKQPGFPYVVIDR